MEPSSFLSKSIFSLIDLHLSKTGTMLMSPRFHGPSSLVHLNTVLSPVFNSQAHTFWVPSMTILVVFNTFAPKPKSNWVSSDFSSWCRYVTYQGKWRTKVFSGGYGLSVAVGGRNHRECNWGLGLEWIVYGGVWVSGDGTASYQAPTWLAWFHHIDEDPDSNKY